MKKYFLPLIMCFCLLSISHVQVTWAAAKAAVGNVQQVALADMGFPDGVVFEGGYAEYTKELFFRLPLDAKVTDASFNLSYRASAVLNELSSVTVLVNDKIQQQSRILLDGGMNQIAVVLPAKELRNRKFLKVTLRVALLAAKNNQLNADIDSSLFFQVLPDTALTMTYPAVATSMRDAWRMLPHQVRISLPAGQMQPAQFSSALALMDLLVRRGKEVQFTRLPALGDIMMGSKTDVRKALIQQKQEAVAELSGNMSLVHSESGSVVTVTEPYDIGMVYLLEDEWDLLGTDSFYQKYKPVTLDKTAAEKADYYEVALEDLGLNTESKKISREADWSMTLNPFSYPAGTVPYSLRLNMIVPVLGDKEPKYKVYVFLNNILVRTMRLKNVGLPQQLVVMLTEDYRQQYDRIRIVVQRDIKVEGYNETLLTSMVQITPDSSLVVRQQTVEPVNFSKLSVYLAGGFDTYLEMSALSQPEAALRWLAKLSTDYPLRVDYKRLQFVEDGGVITPVNPFIALGKLKVDASFDTPVRFDQGQIDVRSGDDVSVLDLNQVPDLVVAQIAAGPSVYGLVLTPYGAFDLVSPGDLRLSQDNVAFIDSSGILMTVDSRFPDLVGVHYRDSEDWLAELDQYGFLILGLAWFLFSLFILYLKRMSARHEDKISNDANSQKLSL